MAVHGPGDSAARCSEGTFELEVLAGLKRGTGPSRRVTPCEAPRRRDLGELNWRLEHTKT